MSFFVGQKVVCVDDSLRARWRRNDWFERFRSWNILDHNLNRGDVYTVTHVDIVQTDGGAFEVLLVAEAKHFEFPWLGFPSFQFRPLIERKTDISIFTELLTPTGPRVLEPADG